MNSDLAIHIAECLKEVDGIEINWRVIKKYADDWQREKRKSDKLWANGLEYGVIDERLAEINNMSAREAILMMELLTRHLKLKEMTTRRDVI